ncbi:MAG: hypothetical protein OXG05_07320 [Gammaproteobacteria bacterium]|nr:hypothetical protein [Gammaproteobacteria bacterium]
MVEACRAVYSVFEAVRFDLGFHSPDDCQQLDVRLTLNALPNKGYRNVADQVRENNRRSKPCGNSMLASSLRSITWNVAIWVASARMGMTALSAR